MISDSLFESVKRTLLQRWVLHLLPPLFTGRPAQHLKTMVFLWWHLHQESMCVRHQINRTIWQRELVIDVYILDTDEILGALLTIYNQIDVNALLNFRLAQESEQIALALLTTIIAYYQDPTTQHFTQWLQIL